MGSRPGSEQESRPVGHPFVALLWAGVVLLVMRAGKIVESGPAEDVYHHPREAYTKALIEAVPVVR